MNENQNPVEIDGSNLGCMQKIFEKSPTQWTSELPKESDHYWCRRKDSPADKYVVKVFADWPCDYMKWMEWWPIPVTPLED